MAKSLGEFNSSHALLLLALAAVFIPLAMCNETTDTTVHCVTRFASEMPNSITTQSFSTTITNTRIEQATQIADETITLPAKTMITTEFSTFTAFETQNKNKATYSTTDIQTSVQWSITTITKVSTENLIATITTTPSSTRSTSAGFTPVFSLPAVISRGGGSVRHKRARRKPEPRAAPAPTSEFGLAMKMRGGKFWLSKPQYPTLLKCTEVYAVQTTTTYSSLVAGSATVTRPAPTEVLTITIPTTITSTLPAPEATATETFLETTSVISISTQTEYSATTVMSSTTTVAAPLETFYANCQADNIMNAVGGNAIASFNLRNGLVSALAAASPYDCCVQCVLTPNCAGTIFGAGFCYLLADKGGYRDPAVDSWSFASSPNVAFSSFVSNGNAGQGVFTG